MLRNLGPMVVQRALQVCKERDGDLFTLSVNVYGCLLCLEMGIETGNRIVNRRESVFQGGPRAWWCAFGNG